MHRRRVNAPALDFPPQVAHTAIMLIKGIKVQPVAWATSLLTVLVAVEAVNEGAHLLPASWSPYLLGAIAALTAILGVLTHGAVTPLARPRDDAGVALVPVTMKAPPSSSGSVGGAGMRSW
jgi:hypothetical protein